MRLVYYFLYGAFGLLGLWFVVTSLAGRYQLGEAPQWIAKTFLLAGAVAGIAILQWAYRLGEVRQSWTKGAGAVLLAVLSFQVIQVAGAVTYALLRRR